MKLVDMLKGIFREIINEDILDKVSVDEESEEDEDEDVETAPTTPSNTNVPVVSLKAVTSQVVNPNRFINLGNDLYFCKNIVTTTFCNKEDFKGETYTLADDTVVHRDKMKGIRGISLPYRLNKNLICYVYNRKNGLVLPFRQTDVGPGWTDDRYWISGTNPKNEGGLDFRGNKSVKAGLDMFPQCWEDLGLHSFEDAYNGSYQAILDVLIYDPQNVSTNTKVTGNEAPSKDSRPWVADLPPTGSPFFSWSELLRGYNLNQRPSDEQIKNLLTLTKELLHPCRLGVGGLRIGSALRDPVRNKEVGGREGSLHLSGRAADLVPLEISMDELYAWIPKNLKPKIRECVNEQNHVHLSGPILPGETQNIRVK